MKSSNALFIVIALLAARVASAQPSPREALNPSGQYFFDETSGIRMDSEVIDVVDDERWKSMGLNWRPKTSFGFEPRQTSRREIGPDVEMLIQKQNGDAGNPKEGRASYSLSNSELLDGIFRLRKTELEMRHSSLFRLYVALDSPASAAVTPDFVEAVKGYLTMHIARRGQARATASTGYAKGILGELPVAGALANKVLSQHFEAAIAKRDYKMGQFIEESSSSIDRMIMELEKSRLQAAAALRQKEIETKGSPASYLLHDELVEAYDNSSLTFDRISPAAIDRQLTQLFINASSLANGDSAHVQIHVNESLQVTAADVIAPYGDKLAERLQETFPEGIPLSKLAVERRIVQTPTGGSTPSGVIHLNETGSVKHISPAYSRSRDLNVAFERNGGEFLNDFKDLSGRESY